MVGRGLLLSVLAAAPLWAQMPAGWMIRPDKGEAAEVKFAAMGGGYHVTPGQAGIMYREADKVAGKFHTLATFTQTKAPAHPEAYGIFFAGQDLAGAGQSYTYFLVRGDGKYLIKKRAGATPSTVVDWTDSDAVQKGDAAGKATNKLEIDASGPKVAFLVNGKKVYEMDAGSVSGIVGLRVNHALDVHIDGFEVHKL